MHIICKVSLSSPKIYMHSSRFRFISCCTDRSVWEYRHLSLLGGLSWGFAWISGDFLFLYTCMNKFVKFQTVDNCSGAIMWYLPPPPSFLHVSVTKGSVLNIFNAEMDALMLVFWEYTTHTHTISILIWSWTTGQCHAVALCVYFALDLFYLTWPELKRVSVHLWLINYSLLLIYNFPKPSYSKYNLFEQHNAEIKKTVQLTVFITCKRNLVCVLEVGFDFISLQVFIPFHLCLSLSFSSGFYCLVLFNLIFFCTATYNIITFHSFSGIEHFNTQQVIGQSISLHSLWTTQGLKF